MSKPKPTFALVPGAWNAPTIYTFVQSHLTTHGYPSIALPLSSINTAYAYKDFIRDVLTIRSYLHTLVNDEAKDVILVIHSFSGLPGCEAPKGSSKKEREKNGLKEGVIRWAVITGLAVDVGFQAAEEGDYTKFAEWVHPFLQESPNE